MPIVLQRGGCNPFLAWRIVFVMRKIALFAVIAVAAVGCKPSPEKQIVGSWKATDVQLAGPMGNNPAFAAMKSQLNGAVLSMKEDKKYSITVAGQAIDGEWTISGRTATLQPKTMGGRSIADIEKQAKQMGMGAMAGAMSKASSANLSEDGKSLDAEIMSMKFKFAKSGD